MSFLKGLLGTNQVDVNADNELKVALSKFLTKAGYAALMAINDDGAAGSSGGVQARRGKISVDGRLSTGMDSLLDGDIFNYSAQHTGKHNIAVTTMAFTLAGLFLNLNSGAITTTTTGAYMSTRQNFTIPNEGALVVEKFLQLSAINATNTQMLIGWFLPGSATAIPLDGVYVRISSAGIEGVINNNGTETSSGVFTFTPSANTTFKLKIIINNQAVDFYINDVLQKTMTIPAANAQLVSSPSLPVSAQIRLTGTASVGTILKVGGYSVWAQDSNNNIPLLLAKALQGNNHQGQQGGTMGSIANYANSTNPGAAVPTNTTAALGTGLGGQFWETDTLAVTTDGIICSFQNPAGTVAIPGKNLLVHGVWIDSYIQSALTGGGYNAQWSIAYGHTNVSLATAESATAKAPRRVPIGSNSVVSAAAALAQLNRVFIQFANPIVVYPGEFIAIVKKKVGTAPSAGVVAHTITIDHVLV